MFAKDKCCLQGSLNKLAKRLKIDRGEGDAHQAGSDSYITIGVFYKLIKCGILTKDLMKKYKNILYGIGLGEDNDIIMKYLKNEEKDKCKNMKHSARNNDNSHIVFDNYNYENNNHMSNNCLFYSNNKNINYSLINANCFGVNYFNSNLFYYDNIKNVSKMRANQKLTLV